MQIQMTNHEHAVCDVLPSRVALKQYAAPVFQDHGTVEEATGGIDVDAASS